MVQALTAAERSIDTYEWFFFGDSHITTIQHAAEQGWLPQKAEFLFVPGATAVGLRNPNSLTNAVETFRANLIPAKPDVLPVMQLGEVDCGFVIWWRAAQLRETIEDQLEASIAAYFAFVDELLAAGYPTVLVTAAAIPTIRDGQDWGEVANKRRDARATLEERTALTLQYNARLAQGACERRCPFVDISADLLDPSTGVIDDSYRHDDPLDHHLHPERGGKVWASALARAVEQLRQHDDRSGATPAEAFDAYLRAMRDPSRGTGPRIRQESYDVEEPSRSADEFPNDPPDTEFGKLLRNQPLPERYTRKAYTARPFHPFRDGPAWGMAFVVLGLVGYWLAGVFGWR